MRGRALAIPIAACLAALCGCGGDAGPNPSAKKKSPEPLRAEVLTVEQAAWPTTLRAQGSLVADEVAVVGTRIDGRVAEVHVDLGAEVKANAPLATLDQQLLKLEVTQAIAQLNQARSALGMKPDDSVDELDPKQSPAVRQEEVLWKEAQANLQRAQRLSGQNAITARELEQFEFAENVARNRHAAAQNSALEKIALIRVRMAELDLARERLADSVIRAPFDGQVQHRQVAPGTFIRTGDPVATLVRTHPLRFHGSMPERQAQQLRVGQPVELKIESIDEPRTVQVTRISPALDPLSRALVFEADIANQDRQLRTGLFAEARVIVDSDAQALVVPKSAVLEFAGAEKVWKVVAGEAIEHEVLIGQRRGDRLQIVEGLEAGDVILRDAAEGRVGKVVPLSAMAPPETVVGAPSPKSTSE